MYSTSNTDVSTYSYGCIFQRVPQTKSSDDIDQYKMAALEARIRAIKEANLYDPI
jgi:hypothetical protein